MGLSELYDKMSILKKDKEAWRSLRAIVRSRDAGRVEIKSRDVIEVGVYIPKKIEEKILELADDHFLAIVGDNGDGKSTLLKALSFLLKEEGARYVTLEDIEEVKDERYFIDGIDELIEVDEEGSLRLKPRYTGIIGDIILSFSRGTLSRGPVIGATYATIGALYSVRTDFSRRIKTILDLRSQRKNVNKFLVTRDVAFYAVERIMKLEKAMRIHERFIQEAGDLDVDRRIPSFVNSLYNDFFSYIFSKEDPVEEVIKAPERYHEAFEKNAVEILRKVAKEVNKSFKDVVFSIRKLGRSGRPDAEIVIDMPDGSYRIAFEAKFLSSGSFSTPGYVYGYPYTIYFIASPKKIEEGIWIPYSLGYLIALDAPEVNDFHFYYEPLIRREIYRGIASLSKKGEEIISSKFSRAVDVLQKLSEDRKKDGTIKAFKAKKVEKLGMNIDELLEIIDQYCPGLIEKSRGRYRFSREPGECIEKLKKLI